MKLRWPRMSRADRRRWQSARTLTDLGGLMAQWLGGEIASWPGYAPNHGPDEETAEAGLVPVLAACNRAGYVTIASQPGWGPGPGYDGLTWCQRAAVEGFITDHRLLQRLADAAEEAGMQLLLAGRLDTGRQGITVTTRDHRPYTGFGGHLDGPNLRNIWRGISPAALEEIYRATQVTIVDPQWGRNDVLWPLLKSLSEPAGGCPACGLGPDEMCVACHRCNCDRHETCTRPAPRPGTDAEFGRALAAGHSPPPAPWGTSTTEGETPATHA
jgi:hypothetical protein